ncbi:RNA polymerase sigma factor [Brevibacillus borstelensis]|uniref:RNA polymerase sigma factor n=1 Tax=Brevibacillus borstelensis TaxID=45462 RepID=UPI0030BA3439
MQDDQAVIEQVLQGDKEAYAQLIDKYKGKVLSLVRRMLGHSEAEDIAQEIFMRAYTCLPDYRGECKFSTWLFRIASNRCIDELRKRKRAPVNASLETELACFLTPEAAYLEKEQHALFFRQLMALDKDYRSVLLLRYSQSLSYLEIAERLSITVEAVQMRLYRARKKLKISLSQPQPSVKEGRDLF